MEEIFTQFVESIKKSHQPLKNEMVYGLYPAGKLFRPKLFKTITEHFEIPFNLSVQQFSLFLETHHAYTLIHDDLPCMDDSDMRRGKESLQKKYGEWKAVLTGDALLALSYELLANTECYHQKKLSRFTFWATGSKGLIAGQAYDLSASRNITYEFVKRIHDLKTGRLILLATIAPYYFLKDPRFDLFKKLWRFGTVIGSYFQLQDDFTDSKDELDQSLNVFHIDKVRATKELEKAKSELSNYLLEFPGVKILVDELT